MNQLPLEAGENLYRWLNANAFGYWIHRDGSVSYAFYRPAWWERLAIRIFDGDKWVAMR